MSFLASTLAVPMLFGMAATFPQDAGENVGDNKMAQVSVRPAYPNLGDFVGALQLAGGEGLEMVAGEDGTMTLTGPAEAVDRASKFAAEVEANPAGVDAALPQVNVETRFITIRRADFDKLPAELRVELAKTFLTGKPTRIANVDALLGDAGGEQMMAPNLTLFGGQTGMMTIGKAGAGMDWNRRRAAFVSDDFQGLALEISATPIDDKVAIYFAARLTEADGDDAGYDVQFDRMFVTETDDDGIAPTLAAAVTLLSEDESGQAVNDRFVLTLVRAAIIETVEADDFPLLQPAD